METLITLSESIRIIISLGGTSLIVAGLLGGVYFALSLVIPSVFIMESLPYVLIIGGFIGAGSQQTLVSLNRNKNRLNKAQTNIEIAQKYIDFIQHNKELSYLTEDQVLKSTDQILNNLLLSPQETESTNLLEPEEQKQISPSQEEA